MNAPVNLRTRPVGGPKNLVRLVYLDEAGTTTGASWLAVAGVIVHGDQQWREADRRVAALIDKHIPKADRPGFVFHATDIFHGSRYFDRKKPEWASRERRWAILEDLAQIISDLKLPVAVAGGQVKELTDADVHQSSRRGLRISPARLTRTLLKPGRTVCTSGGLAYSQRRPSMLALARAAKVLDMPEVTLAPRIKRLLAAV